MSGSWTNVIPGLFVHAVLVSNIHIMPAKAMIYKPKLKYFNRLKSYLLTVNMLGCCRWMCLFYIFPHPARLSSVIPFGRCHTLTAAVFVRTPILQCLR